MAWLFLALLIPAAVVLLSARRRGFVFHDWNTPLGRSGYAAVMLFLVAIALNAAKVAATVASHKLTAFGIGYYALVGLLLDSASTRLVLVLILGLAGYFTYHYTSRRLLDAGLSPYFAPLVLLPGVNVIFVALLCLLPTKHRLESRDDTARRFRDWLPRSRFGSAALAAVVTGLAAVAMTFISAKLGAYGWVLFVLTPFTLGFLAVWIYGHHEPHSLTQCLNVAMFSALLQGALLLAFALEGLICIVLAAPLAMVMTLPGAYLGFALFHRGRLQPPPQTFGALLIALPLLMAVESRMVFPEPMRVESAVVINASPQHIWPLLMKLEVTNEPSEVLFRNGGAYPIGTASVGSGVGASRDCRLSSGDMKEVIDIWEPNRRLRFRVLEQPLLLKELSPYDILPPHVEEHYLRSHAGEFRLTPLPDGSTRVEGTTWYENKLWPSFYWQVYSDKFVRDVQMRVLNEIKRQAEAQQTASLDR